MQAVEDLCVQKQGSKIYDLLLKELHTNISSKVVSLQQQQAGDLRSFLLVVDTIWNDHIEQLNTIRNIFLYLDRYIIYT